MNRLASHINKEYFGLIRCPMSVKNFKIVTVNFTSHSLSLCSNTQRVY